MLNVGEILGDRTPFSVAVTATVAEVVDYLCDKQIGAVAVCKDETVEGVFSERDLMRRVVHKKLDPTKTKIADVMTTDVYSVPMEETCRNARLLMFGKNFRHLVVTDSIGKFRGFVSMRELLEVDLKESQALVHQLNDSYYQHQFEPPPRPPADADTIHMRA